MHTPNIFYYRINYNIRKTYFTVVLRRIFLSGGCGKALIHGKQNVLRRRFDRPGGGALFCRFTRAGARCIVNDIRRTSCSVPRVARSGHSCSRSVHEHTAFRNRRRSRPGQPASRAGPAENCPNWPGCCGRSCRFRSMCRSKPGVPLGKFPKPWPPWMRLKRNRLAEAGRFRAVWVPNGRPGPWVKGKTRAGRSAWRKISLKR